jgi:hypothetical protein
VPRLDAFAPVWHFHEAHRLFVAAPPDRVYAATKAVTAREIRFFRTLTWLRRLGRPGPPDILNPPPDRPILEVATETGFLLLENSPPDPVGEIVIGKVVIARPGATGPRTAEEYRGLAGTGWARATMNFLIEPRGRGSLVTTETRVHATDDRTRRRFGRYWMLIYPGSALIRRMWLRAIKRRALGTYSPALAR